MRDDSTPRTITARSPTDLLALVPGLLGFHPAESVVLLTLGGGREPFHARIDLPDGADEVRATVQALLAPVSSHGIDRVAILVYCADAETADRVVTPLHAALTRCGVEVVEAVRADGHRWFPLRGGSGSCGRAQGTPYDLTSHPLVVRSVVAGRVTLPDRQHLVDSLVGDDPAAVAEVADAARRHVARWAASLRHPLGPADPEGPRAHAAREARWVRDRVRRFLVEGSVLDAEDTGRLVVAVSQVQVRDVAWAQMTRASAEHHVSLWRDVVRRSPEHLLAAPAALLGFAAWLSGNGALAWCGVDRCSQAAPGYPMATRLARLLAGAVSPSSWRPVDPDSPSLLTG